jgi:chemotaxis protein CheD
MGVKYSDIGLFLEPGQLFVSGESVLVKTILGSCVAVCLYDRARRIGGINHYLLPYPGKDTASRDARYGQTSVTMLVTRMQEAGAVLSRLRSVVVGGGRPVGGERGPQVGAANREVAVEMLQRYGIPILKEDTGGEYGRRVYYNTGTGEITVSVIKPTYIQPRETGGRPRP